MTGVNSLDPALTQLLSLAAPGDAIRIALWRAARVRGETRADHAFSAISDFAERHGFDRANTTNAIYGRRAIPLELIHALMNELGGATEQEWREIISRTADAVVAAAA